MRIKNEDDMKPLTRLIGAWAINTARLITWFKIPHPHKPHNTQRTEGRGKGPGLFDEDKGC